VIRLLKKYEGLIILVAIVVMLRLPSLFEPYWYGDEQIYLAIGQGVRKGLVLYRDITDYPNKPPLIYLLAAAAGSVFWFKFMLMMWNVVHVVVVNRLLARLWGEKKWLVWGGSGAFILLTALPMLEGNIANGEMFMTMPVTLAMLLLWKAQYFWAGLMLALGFLFKIPVAAEVVAAGLAFWVFRHSFKGIISFGIGFGLPIAVVLGAWYGMGVAPIDLVQNMLGSSKYVTNYPLAPRLILVAGITGGLYLIKKRLSRKLIWAGLWLIWALFGATLSGRPYPHYFIQIVVPVIVTLGVVLVARNRLQLAVGSAVLALVGLTLVILKVPPYPVMAYYANFGRWVAGQKSFSDYAAAFDQRMPRNYKLAYYLTTHTSPEARIYIWGNQPDVYVMADRLPVGKLVTSFHVEDLQAYAATMEWLKNDPPAYIVMMADEPRQFKELEYWLDQNYLETDTIGAAKVYKKL
jgi:hypothetical protein